MSNRNIVLLLASFAIGCFACSTILQTFQQVLMATGAMFSLLVVIASLYFMNQRLWAIDRNLSVQQGASAFSLVSEMHSMHVIFYRFPQCSIPTSTWSMRFSNLHAVVEILDEVQPKCVVEFGSGISTICIASWIKDEGEGELYSIDHDEKWAKITKRHLIKNSLDNVAKVINSRLSTVQVSNKSQEWYDSSFLKSLPERIDLVIVDGPPAGRPDTKYSRYPALPMLYDRLSENAIVVLDDAKRSGESQVIFDWIAEYPEFRTIHIDSLSGLAILKRNG